MSTASNDVRKAEAEGKSMATVEFRGHKFEISRDQADWSLDLLEALEDGRNIGILRASFGPRQWRIIKSMNLMAPDVDALAEAAAVALGFTSVGESPASSD
jgi:hypothetical protein